MEPLLPQSHGHAGGPTVTTLGQDFLVQMERAAHVFAFQHAPQPLNFISRLEKGVLAEEGRVPLLHDIVDLPDSLAGDVPDALDLLGHEEQILGIDVAVLDESPRLLWTATGIALIHEPALAVHKAMQVPASSGQALTKIVRRHLQHVAAHGIGGAEDLAQRKDKSLFAVQAEQHSHRAAILRFLNEKRLTDGPFIEAKEVLGGYWIVEASSKEELVKWAQQCPADEDDVIEIREIFGEADFPIRK
jgi:hypothetical protein